MGLGSAETFESRAEVTQQTIQSASDSPRSIRRKQWELEILLFDAGNVEQRICSPELSASICRIPSSPTMIYVHVDGLLPPPRSSKLSGNDFSDVVDAEARPERRVVSGLAGSLLRSRGSFPYFMLVALEAGSPLRALLLLISFPIAWILANVLLVQEAEMRIFTFIAFAGLRASAVECVARGVLPRAYLDDLHPRAHKVFASCSKRSVVTSSPRIMVEPFARDHLGAEHVMGTEVQVTRGGFCTGLIAGNQGVMLGHKKARGIREHFGSGKSPDIGIGDLESDNEFLQLCKKAYVVGDKNVEQLAKSDYIKPLVFHDGRLVHRPTPLWALTLLLWLPIAIPLAVVRIFVGTCLPKWLAMPINHFLGVSLRIRGNPPGGGQQGGVLFVLPHRTLVDPLSIYLAMGRPVTAVTYSLSPVSEVLSPIKTVRLTRCKARDSETMSSLLKQGHLAVCPEGTTCREPFLLRFSSLFAELTDQILPVSLSCTMPVFHGSSARGWKCLDALFFFMNPVASYEVNFLEQLPVDKTCKGGMSSQEVANHVQRLLADALGFQCTNLTRKDKYRILAGNDGIVPPQSIATDCSSEY